MELAFKHLKIIADVDGESASQTEYMTLQKAIDTYTAFKCSLPTYYAILLNSDCTKTILVKGKGDTSWTFPNNGGVNCFESHAPLSAKRFNLVVPYINELRRQIKEIMDTKYNKDEEDSCPADHSNRIEENDGIFNDATKRAKFERNVNDNGFE